MPLGLQQSKRGQFAESTSVRATIFMSDGAASNRRLVQHAFATRETNEAVLDLACQCHNIHHVSHDMVSRLDCAFTECNVLPPRAEAPHVGRKITTLSSLVRAANLMHQSST